MYTHLTNQAATNNFALWTKEEEAKTISCFRQGMRISQIAEELGRTTNAVRMKLKKMGEIAGAMSRSNEPWVNAEAEKLRLYLDLQYSEIECARLLGRTVDEVRRYMVLNGYREPMNHAELVILKRNEHAKYYTPWADEERDLLRELFPLHQKGDMTVEEIADRLERTVGAVARQVRKLHLVSDKKGLPFGDDEKRRIDDYRNLDYSSGMIANLLGRSFEEIEAYVVKEINKK